MKKSATPKISLIGLGILLIVGLVSLTYIQAKLGRSSITSADRVMVAQADGATSGQTWLRRYSNSSCSVLCGQWGGQQSDQCYAYENLNSNNLIKCKNKAAIGGQSNYDQISRSVSLDKIYCSTEPTTVNAAMEPNFCCCSVKDLNLSDSNGHRYCNSNEDLGFDIFNTDQSKYISERTFDDKYIPSQSSAEIDLYKEKCSTVNSNVLTETFCSLQESSRGGSVVLDPIIYKVKINCPAGCVNGACLQPTVTILQPTLTIVSPASGITTVSNGSSISWTSQNIDQVNVSYTNVNTLGDPDGSVSGSDTIILTGNSGNYLINNSQFVGKKIKFTLTGSKTGTTLVATPVVLTLDITASQQSTVQTCGNGLKEGTEVCDDGNTTNGDGCSSTCMAIEANYSCTVDTAGKSTCKKNPGAVCLQNDDCVSGYKCSSTSSALAKTCMKACSNQSDCSTVGNGACTSDGVCLPAKCGDKIKNIVGGIEEGCDDGGTAAGDGCSATCQVESGYECSGATCEKVCLSEGELVSSNSILGCCIPSTESDQVKLRSHFKANSTWNSTTQTCSQPVTGQPIGICSSIWAQKCGDGVCSNDENRCNCPADCGAGYATVSTPLAGYEYEVVKVKTQSYGNPFSDITGAALNTEKAKAATALYQLGIIGGYKNSDGTFSFQGTNKVNRAEAAKFLLFTKYQNNRDTQVGYAANNNRFRDVVEGQWYTRFVIKAADLGVIDGYDTDGDRNPDSFGPARTVNTAEFLKMLSMALSCDSARVAYNLDYGGNNIYYDVPVNSSEWYRQFVPIAKACSLFPDRGNYLNASRELTRDEVAVAIYNFYDKCVGPQGGWTDYCGGTVGGL